MSILWLSAFGGGQLLQAVTQDTGYRTREAKTIHSPYTPDLSRLSVFVVLPICLHIVFVCLSV